MKSVLVAQENMLELLIQKFLVNQEKATNEINIKVDNMYNDLNGSLKFSLLI